MKKAIIVSLISFVFLGCSQNRFDAVTYFMESGNLEKAELILKYCSKKEKNTFAYNHLMGVLLIKTSVAGGNKREALNSFLKANEYDSENYLNNLLISKMYIEVNDLRNAETFALIAKEIATSDTENVITTFDNDVYYVLAKIYFKKKNYENAYENIMASPFQDNVQVVFLRTEISDLRDGTHMLDSLFQKYDDEKLLTDAFQTEYMDYLFLNMRIKDADILADKFLEHNSPCLKKYGCLFKAYIDMLKNNAENAEKYIKKSYDYKTLDPLCLTQKMRVFYNFLAEEDPKIVFNSFLIYIWLYDNDDKATRITKEDLTEIYEYFKDDIYFNLLFSEDILTMKLEEVARLEKIKNALLENSDY